MGRYFHKLKPNKSAQRPRSWILFDTEAHIETDAEGEQTQTLRLGVGVLWQPARPNRPERLEWADFTTPGEFWDIVERWAETDRTTGVLAHNIGYDFRLVDGFAELDSREWVNRLMFLMPAATILVYRKGKAKLKLLSTTNYARSSLEEIAAELGMVKPEVADFTTVSTPELRARCRADVEILLAFWREWLAYVDAHGCGVFAPTISSQALTAWRHAHMARTVYIHADGPATALERAAYYGGRTEAYFIGKPSGGPFYKLDVNSMYPYVMSTARVPFMLIGRYKRIPVERFKTGLGVRSIVARVKVRTDEPVYPCRLNGRLCFPVGEFETTLTTPEFSYALERGHIRRVHEFALYKSDILFADYVAYFYALRKKLKAEGRRVWEKATKVMLNALYGKWGQRSTTVKECENWFNLPEGSHPGLYSTGQEPFTLWVIGKRCYLVRHEGESSHSFPAIAAHITAAARLHLWRLITMVGRERVLYCDTDSLFVTAEGRERAESLVDAGRLGALKVEATIDDLEIFGAKHYKLDGNLTLKGVRPKATIDASGAFHDLHWQTLRGAIRDGDTSRVIVSPVVKRIAMTYLKGHVAPSGVVSPFVLACS